MDINYSKNQNKLINYEIKKLNNEILKLKNKLNKEKDKNKKEKNKYDELIKIKNNLENELKEEKNKNKELIDKLNLLNKSNNNNSLIKELQKIIESQDKTINDLKSQINNNALTNLPGEKILAVNFNSLDQKVNFPIATKNTEIFVFLELRFYNEYPEYKEKDIYFLVNGNRINRFKNMEENNIKNGNKIFLNIIDE